MKYRFLLLLTLILTLTLTPVYAHHDGTAAEHAPGGLDTAVPAIPSFTESKFNQLKFAFSEYLTVPHIIE